MVPVGSVCRVILPYGVYIYIVYYTDQSHPVSRSKPETGGILLALPTGALS